MLAILLMVVIDVWPVKLLAAMATLGAIAVTGLSLSELRAGQRPMAARRWLTLLISGAAAVTIALLIPWLTGFAAPLGDGVTAGVGIVGVVMAALFAVLAWWGFTREH